MGHLDFDKETKKLGSWKTFYIALAVCIVAVGGVAAATFLSSLTDPDIADSSDPAPMTQAASTTKKDQSVGHNVTDVPDERTTTAPAATESTAPPTAAPADLFILPLSNEVIRVHSNGEPVYNKTMGDWRVHNGVDFRGETGQTVKALAGGTIVEITEDLMWGKVLIIDHGSGIRSKYCGVATSGLTAGDIVNVDDTLGILCDIPCEVEDGPHLHLEITVNGQNIDPIEAIGRSVKYSLEDDAEDSDED